MADPRPGRVRDLPTLARSIHCFRGCDRPRASPRARAKFSSQEREKIREVRRQGACLRCRMLKIQCSNENPCQPCLQSAVKGSERKVLSFCYCVRTRFIDVNIFHSAQAESAAKNMQIETLMARMGILLARIAVPANFTLTSDPVSFRETLTTWLSDPNFVLPNGSVVGLCCSSLLSLQFRDDSLGDDGLVTEFRRFLLASSLVHGGWRGARGELGTVDLSTVGHVSGYRLMKRLDRTLTPQFLAKCDRESCQVLFFLVLGTVLGIGYASSFPTNAPSTSPQLLGAEFQQSPTLWLAMKEHLCQMLAHHLIFLGSMLGIKLDTGLEQRIIETAASRWNKMESFIWASAACPPQPGEVHSGPETRAFLKRDAEPVPRYDENPCYWEEPPPPPPPAPCLVPVACPELARFQSSTVNEWGQNPTSYLDMTDEIDQECTPPATAEDQEPDTLPSYKMPFARDVGSSNEERRETKRRTMWFVGPYNAGPEHGEINVHARLRGGRQMDEMRFFV